MIFGFPNNTGLMPQGGCLIPVLCFFYDILSVCFCVALTMKIIYNNFLEVFDYDK